MRVQITSQAERRQPDSAIDDVDDRAAARGRALRGASSATGAVCGVDVAITMRQRRHDDVQCRPPRRSQSETS